VSERTDWRASRARRWQAGAIAAAGYPLVALLGQTLRWRVDGLERLGEVARAGRQPVLAFWHGRILSATYYFRRRGIWVMASENFDGEWIARIIRRFGYHPVRGSTSRGGGRALVLMKRRIERNEPAAFTLDGPRGPALRAQRGAAWLAKATGNPIVPFHIEARRSWTLGSWDRTQIPRPFSTVGLAVGEPIYVASSESDDGLEAVCRDLERRLEDLRARALALAHLEQ
jgi:lysophospholipid acyltransferase (LPLAT)-like uncharacterized protein